MITDEYSDSPAEDRNTDDRPDDAHDLGSDGFDDFQTDPTKRANDPRGGGQSLGEIWRNNPIIKIGMVLVVVVAIVMGLVMFGGGDDADAPSSVGAALDEREAPGNETSEAYREAINEANQQGLDQAMQDPRVSHIDIPVASPDAPQVQPNVEEPPVNIDDPLADWRATSQPTGAQQPLEPGAPTGTQTLQPGPAQPLGPDPAAVDALAQAMAAQMQSILDKHQIGGPQIMSVTDKGYFQDLQTQNGTNVALAGQTTEEVREIIIPAGTIVYAQTLTEANTDAPGPVLARLSSGPLQGARILGTFQDTDKYLTLNFNTIVVNGISQSTNAVALDPKTTLPAVATEIDHRYWRRVILPAAARFIEGMGDAIAQREQTNVSVNGSTVTSSQPDLNTREELAAGLSEGTQELADELDREGDSTRVMIKVHAGTPVGILFLEPVLKESD